MRLLSSFVLISLMSSLIACSGEDKEASEIDAPDETRKDGVAGIRYAAGFTDSLKSCLNDYYNLKDAFVAADTAGVRNNAIRLQKNLSALSLQEIQGKDSVIYLSLKDRPKDALSAIDDLLQETDLEKQRESFEVISQVYYDLIQAAKPAGIRAYNQFCPMAFNDKGAYWLSAADSIMNPYFGKKMLHCGEVKETLNFY